MGNLPEACPHKVRGGYHTRRKGANLHFTPANLAHVTRIHITHQILWSLLHVYILFRITTRPLRQETIVVFCEKNKLFQVATGDVITVTCLEVTGLPLAPSLYELFA